MSKGKIMYPGTQGIEACGDRGDVSSFDEARTTDQVTLVGSPVLKGRVDVTTIQIEDENFGPAFEYLSGILSLVDAGLLVQDYTDSHTTLFNEAFSVSTMGENYPTALRTLGKNVMPEKLLVSPFSMGSQCHAMSALLWFQDPARYEIHTGIVGKRYFHTWVYDAKEDIIYEPTPWPHDPYSYFGIKIANPELFFAKQKQARFQDLYQEVISYENPNPDLKAALLAALKHS